MEIELEPEARSKQFDIWGLIQRAHTTNPYIIMAKHRMNKSSTKRWKSASKVIGRRRRRRATLPNSPDSGSSMSHTSVDWYDPDSISDDFNYDAEVEDPSDPYTSKEHCQVMYVRACKTMQTPPIAYFYGALKSNKCILRHRQITTDEIKTIAIALVGNSSIETLDLTDNDIGKKGIEYLVDMFRENTFIKNLSLADNNLGVDGVKHVVDIVKQLDNLHSLNISGNGLRDCDAEVIRPLIEDTLNLKHLSISHNQLRELGGEVIGEALVWNDTMESLDLSWNHLRLDGGCLIADGLAENSCLKKLNLAWNGLHMDGCRAIARALEENKTLLELDLTCNRISKECLDKLLSGLRRNSTLEILRLGWNPITPAGAMMLLEFVRDNSGIGLNELDLTDQLVEPEFVALLAELEVKRVFKVVYGQVRGQEFRGDDDDEKMLLDENPIIILMEFGKLMGFRLMDLFAALDKDGSKSLDHNEIRNGLRMVNIPLSEKCIDILIDKLDVDGDGEIDFGELMAAQTEHRKKMSKFFAAQEGDIDIEDTEIGRVRIKLSRLMAKKMSGNPSFKRQTRMLLEQLGLLEEQKLPVSSLTRSKAEQKTAENNLTNSTS